ncbi:hypothetical protein [Terrabacter terrigena]|uniref:MFS transporter n=1 Tax=Terrabacter terrigena TaxID=574718 RepID=A0ABW3MZ01_9MICO
MSTDAAQDQLPITQIPPRFKFVVICVLIITGVCLLSNIAIALFVDAPNEQVKDVMKVLSAGFQLGFGTILGLVGGKAA